MFGRVCLRVRVTRRQEFPRGSIVIAGALSRLKTSLQEQREGAPSAIIPLSSLRRSVLHTLPSLYLSLSARSIVVSLSLFPPGLSKRFCTMFLQLLSPPLPPQGGASLLLRLSIGEFDFSASGAYMRDTSMARGRRPRWYLFNFVSRAPTTDEREGHSLVDKQYSRNPKR